MNKLVKTEELFDCKNKNISKLLEDAQYPWEILKNLKDYVDKKISDGIENFTEISDGVFVGEEVKIFENTTILPPAIIGKGTHIRPGAFLRGYVLIGDNCVIGNSTELKNSVLLDNVQVPHYNYVGDSVLGNFAHLGAGSICSNLKSDKKPIIIHGDNEYETGLKKLGAILADNVEIGCGCVLNPGTIIGKRTSVYPLTSVRGIIAADCIVKSMENIVERI